MWLLQHRRPIRSGDRHLDADNQSQWPRRTRNSHSSVDRHGDDRLGGYSADYDIKIGQCVELYHSDGSRYNPATDTWGDMREALSGRSDHTAVWTDTEMIVWGGGGLDNPFNTGGRYDPVTGAWRATSTEGAPSARRGHTAVWTGREMIVWGGSDPRTYVNSGGRYCASAGREDQ